MFRTACTARRTRRSPRSKQHGMTLIEMGVVLILIIVVLAFAAGRVGGVFGKSETTEQVAALTQLVVNTKTLRGASGYGPSGTSLVPALIATDGVPSSMPVQSNTIRSAWDATVPVVSTGLGFTISIPAIPKAACVEIANKMSRGGGGMTTKVGSAPAIAGEVTAVAAAASCSTNSNSIVLTINS